DGQLEGPRDLFDDASFDRAREKATEEADYLRQHGPFEPHRLPLEELEYTTLPDIMQQLEDDWESIDDETGDATGTDDVEAFE
ncbi:MAG: fructose 1,6-bisphosphatase, partial [Candidatus Nanohaloarchaea archaeon]|nr:fructose 1,6-bisphosphatase [Candidatus Nanohaloarchaea archaeon]